MQYWINHKGVQSGPVDLDGLKQMGLTSAAYVWHEGLTDWVKITQLPELQGLYEMTADTGAAAGSRDAAATGETMRQESPAAATQPGQCAPHVPTDAGQEGDPIPPSNLMWAIAATVLCCAPLGIVAIINAARVAKCYRAGDIMGARSASQAAAWWSIAAIVVGVVWRPLILSLMCGG